MTTPIAQRADGFPINPGKAVNPNTEKNRAEAAKSRRHRVLQVSLQKPAEHGKGHQ
jgi:hypothetical protein